MPYIHLGQDGRAIFYVRRGPEGARRKQHTLLFHHGLGSTHAFYEPVMATLAGLGYNCVAFDSAGSGLSDEAPRGDHGLDGLVRDVRNVLIKVADDMDLQKVIFIGHSMGGLVVSTIAAELDPAGAVLIGPINPSEAVSKVFATRVKTVEQEGMEPMADAIPDAATGTRATPLQRALLRALLLSQRPLGYVGLCEIIAGAEAPRYEDIRCPVLAIAGEDDQTAKLQVVQEIVASCTNARSKELKVLPGVGHWHCIEDPDHVAAAIASFCESVEKSIAF